MHRSREVAVGLYRADRCRSGLGWCDEGSGWEGSIAGNGIWLKKGLVEGKKNEGRSGEKKREKGKKI